MAQGWSSCLASAGISSISDTPGRGAGKEVQIAILFSSSQTFYILPLLQNNCTAFRESTLRGKVVLSISLWSSLLALPILSRS